MAQTEFLQIALLLAILMACAAPLGNYMAAVFEGSPVIQRNPLGRLERQILRLCGTPADAEMRWWEYAAALIAFNFLGFVLLFVILISQDLLPLNPNNVKGMAIPLALNTAVSFVTNTNWQAYSGESTLSHFAQMAGLGVQNFLSAATGMTVAVALARGFRRDSSITIGSFWTDLVRMVVHILFPLAIVFAVVLVGQGVLQNFAPNLTVFGLNQGRQILPMGPVASQTAISLLGSNGGGFFGVNSAHPFANPTPLSNLLELFAVLLIPVASPLMFGRLCGNPKHGRTLLYVMLGLFLTTLSAAIYSEAMHNAALSGAASLEGKETRFGIASSVLWALSTTATSNGSVNAAMSSMSPLTGGLAMLNMMLGEVVFGGVGSGLYGIVMFAVLTVFVAGLMVGRTPEYLGKKIEAAQMKFAVAAVVAPSAVILTGAALTLSTTVGLSAISSRGPHGLSEVLYAFTSAAANNGSSFAGIAADTTFLNLLLATAMVVGRFVVIIPALAVAGTLASKKTTPVSLGSFPVTGWLFGGLLAAIIVIVGALTFLPALSLGPILEHMLMLSGRTF
jgi:K+-transporting ATPase ATPase A chain